MDFVATLMIYASPAERRAYPWMSRADADALLAKLRRAHFAKESSR